MAGFVLMINAGTGVIGNLLGGYLFDRIGGYKSIMLGIILSMIALVIVNNLAWMAGIYMVCCNFRV